MIYFVKFGKCISCILKMNIIFVNSWVSLIHRAGLQRNGTLGNPNSCSTTHPPPPSHTTPPPVPPPLYTALCIWLLKPLYHHNSNKDDDGGGGGEVNDNLTALCCIFRFVEPYMPLSCTLTCTQWKNRWSRAQAAGSKVQGGAPPWDFTMIRVFVFDNLWNQRIKI
jgi:hypothetical protein